LTKLNAKYYKKPQAEHCLLADYFSAPKMLVLRMSSYATSRNALSLTAHVARTAVSNALISLQCHAYPSWAHGKIYA
jgi:hypothetical protein